MSLRRIKHMFLRLSPEEKVSGLGGLLILVGLFMPWYSVVMSFDSKSVSQNGLSGDLGVLGFVSLLMVLLALFYLVGDYLHMRLPRLGYTKEQILFFLMGENAFLILLCIAIYTKRSLDYTDASLRFGIYVALIGAIFGTFSIFSQMQKMKKKEVSEFFDHEEGISEKAGRKHEEAVIERGLDEEIVEEKPSRRKHAKVEEAIEVRRTPDSSGEEPDLFEEQVVQEPPEEVIEELEEEMEIKEEPEPEPMSEEELKDEIDEIAEVEEKIFEPELEPEPEPETELEKAEEEEIEEDLEEILEDEEEEKEDKKKKSGKGESSAASMSFYEDQ